MPKVDKITQRPIDWLVVTEGNAQGIFDDLKTGGKGVVLFALTENGYKNITLNTADQLKLVLQQKAVIAGYKAYYHITDAELAAYNARVAADNTSRTIANTKPVKKPWVSFY